MRRTRQGGGVECVVGGRGGQYIVEVCVAGKRRALCVGSGGFPIRGVGLLVAGQPWRWDPWYE